MLLDEDPATVCNSTPTHAHVPLMNANAIATSA